MEEERTERSERGDGRIPKSPKPGKYRVEYEGEDKEYFQKVAEEIAEAVARICSKYDDIHFSKTVRDEGIDG